MGWNHVSDVYGKLHQLDRAVEQQRQRLVDTDQRLTILCRDHSLEVRWLTMYL